jgi:hypothetical protein
MTPAGVIAEVRSLIQDTRVPYRYSDSMLLGFVNQTLKKILSVRPDLFAVVSDFTTTPDTVLQNCPADSTRLIEIFQVKNGTAITEVNRDTIDRSAPMWQNEASGQPVNFMRHVRNPNRFFVYPRPEAGVVLVGEYAQTPPNYGMMDTVTFPTDAYFPSVVDGTVFMAQSIDNEHVNSNRAKLFQDSFYQGLNISIESRVATDTESAGIDPKKVV